jgi:hypothetical protein
VVDDSSDSAGEGGVGAARGSGSRILEIVGRALNALVVGDRRFLSGFGFSSISETAFFGGGGGEGWAAGTSAGTAAVLPLLPTDGAVIARGDVLFGGGAAEDSAAGLEGLERGGLVAIQIDVRERKGGWMDGNSKEVRKLE